MRVLFLGTGTSGGVPMIGCDCDVCRSTDLRDNRLRPSIYLELNDDTRVLVDTTPDLRTQALRYDMRKVDAVLITHAHADHIMGLDEVRRYNYLTGHAVPVYGNEETLADIRRLFSYAFEPQAPKGGVPNIDLMPIDGPFMLGQQQVVPVPVLHGRWNVLGFRFRDFAYLTDCNKVPESSFALLEGLDVLVIDALRIKLHPTHFTLAQAIEMARRIDARQTYFTHIAHDLGHAETSAGLPPGMGLAHDGLVLNLA